MRSAFEEASTFFDRADVYGQGHSEELLATFLSEVGRENVYVATKVRLWRGRQPNP